MPEIRTPANSTEAETSAEQTTAGGRQTPGPRRNRVRWGWIATLAVALVLLAGAYLLMKRKPATSSNGQSSMQGPGQRGRGGGAIPVSVTTVRKGNMGEYISTLGTVTPVYTALVTSRVVGTLTELHYREGQMVHRGDLLAVIDPRPYQATYVQAEGQLQRDQALLANARLDLERYKQAFTSHAIPEQILATQQATVNGDEGTVKLDEGNLDAAKVNLDYTQIRAPIDGRVGLRQTDLGNIVPANGTTPLLTIAQLQPITVIFPLAESYIADVTSQMRAGHTMRVEALSADNTTELSQGTLLTVDNQVDVTTGTVRARAVFANRDYKLFPNQFVNAKLLLKTLMGVNIIPNAAIQRNNDLAFVYVVGANKTVQSRNITVATSDGNNSAVTGVKPGEVLVTDGFDKLQDGTHVTQRPANASAGRAGAGNRMNQSQENQPAPTQGAASTQLNTAQQNPQQPQKGRHK